MMQSVRLTLTAAALLASGRVRRNRTQYGGAAGVRIFALHAEDTDDFDRFKRWVEWCGERMPWVSLDTLGRGTVLTRDALALTMDDGHARTFRAVEWLARVNIPITYFVVPSFIGRSLVEYMAYHAARGVAAFDIAAGRDPNTARGFERSQLVEIEAMGHRIGAHNDSHRDLGRLGNVDADYEINGAIDRLSDMLGHAVDDFAWAFGTLSAITPDALATMRRRCCRVFSCVRGLNVPSVTPAVILREPVTVGVPRMVAHARLLGAYDHRANGQRRALARLSGYLPAEAG